MAYLNSQLTKFFRSVADPETLNATYQNRQDLADARVQQYDSGVKTISNSITLAMLSAAIYYLPSYLMTFMVLPAAAVALAPPAAVAGGALAALGIIAGAGKAFAASGDVEDDVKEYEAGKKSAATVSDTTQATPCCAYCGGDHSVGGGCGAPQRITSRRMSPT